MDGGDGDDVDDDLFSDEWAQGDRLIRVAEVTLKDYLGDLNKWLSPSLFGLAFRGVVNLFVRRYLEKLLAESKAPPKSTDGGEGGGIAENHDIVGVGVGGSRRASGVCAARRRRRSRGAVTAVKPAL